MKSYQKQFSFVVLFICYLRSATSEECINGQFYADPENCERFLQCSNGALYEMSCPAGLHFNPNSEVCEYSSNSSCEIETTTKDVVTEVTGTTEATTTKSTITESTTTAQIGEFDDIECGCESLVNRINEMEARTLALESFAILLQATLETTLLELEAKTTALDTLTTHLEEISDEFTAGISEVQSKAITLESKTSQLDDKSSLLDTRTTQLEEKSYELTLNITVLGDRTRNIETTTSQIDGRETQLNNRVTQLESTTGQLDNNISNVNSTLTQLKGSIVTDIRMGAKISTVVWRDEGVNDVGNGYVITGVYNHDRDSYVDDVHKRQFQKRINGNWVAVGY